ncbi:MAG: FKBP-type peptidyl-prolyl cis-trans isomerase [Caulobacteraceae bacterium]|nr:FKBP-type peptidyl-prolyl cis-trans isomerase [Caulobacteraceae bacterium]
MRFLSLAAPLALALTASAPALAQTAGALATPQAQASYAVGLNLGARLRADGVPLDPDAFLKGVKDALANAKPALTPDQINAALQQLQADIETRRNEAMAKAAETNKAEGEAFLKANAAKPGVVTLPDGLQYQVLTAGSGPKPHASDTVVCNYRGTLIDGTEFDSSAQHGGPASLPLGGVIRGWTEALQLMPTGSKWRLFVPAALAYGETGRGGSIGPNATLIFDIELVSIAKG